MKKKLLIVIIIIAIIIIAVAIGNKQMMKIIYKKDYSEYVSKYAQEYNVEEELIYALIKAESNFNASAKSNKNAKGLMQLMYSTAQEVADKQGIEITEENIMEPDLNINIGTKYISNLLEKYKCIEVALAAYNAGSGNVDKWIREGIIKPDGTDIENIPYKETNMYVRKILRDYKIYMQLEK
ncbi:MAG: lytic transglycosylase domain-containing protein [Clostridia bacterium]|nr:lytic transglycosylase domain-containing protein [Clostridia bacterium]